MTTRLKKFLAYLVIGVIFFFLFRNITSNWQEVKSAMSSFNLLNLAIIIVITTSLHILNSLSWHLLIKSMGFKVAFFESMRIWMFPSIGKYIPGMIWQYLGRMYLLSQKGINKSQGSVVVLLDAIFTLAIGSLVSLLAVSYFNLPVNQNLGWFFIVVIFLPLAIVLLVSNQKILSLIMQIIQKVTKRTYATQSFKFSPIWLTALSAITFSQFVIAGVVLFLITQNLTAVSSNHIFLFSGVYAASWILGYIAIFAPGGLGIQELSIATLLSPFVPLPIASLAALIFRFALTVSELIVLLLVFIFSKKESQKLFRFKH